MADRVIVDCLSFQYNGRDVLKDVSLQLAHGCMLGLLGPNGSGKTTLVRCISGFLRPKSGRVLIDGVDVRGYSARELSKRMAMAPQRSVPEFGFTALDIVLMGRNPHIGLLEDVLIENEQAISMCNIYRDILSGTMDAFASVISNNLNVVMKLLASITIVISIPTIVASFFGMNTWVPWEGTVTGFYVAMAIAFGFSAITAIILWRKKMF